MARESELKNIRRFVCGQLRAEQDLRSLTLGTLKRRYLANVGGDFLSSSAKSLLKQVVQLELKKMQENHRSSSESETEDAQNKRKRERESDTASESENEVASKQKKSRCRVSAESESEDDENKTAGSAGREEEDQGKTGSEDTKQELTKSSEKTNGKCEEDSEDGETEIKTNMAKKKTDQSDDEDISNSNKSDSSKSSEESEKEENVLAEKHTNQADSDSSSLPSEDEQEPQTKVKQVNKKKEKDGNSQRKKSTKKDKHDAVKKQKEDDKAVVRLKRYISLCGERRNYKKLLGDSRSVRSMVAVLKKELEDLGVQGQPSIEKCKKVRLKKEEARELAELDVSNIINSEGRPKRRGAFARQEHREPPLSTYHRSLNSGSDSDQANSTPQGRRRASDWANLRGIISDDVDSD
ncbi:HIRA-interacting protein 3 [Phycodurus eques]|uniref:HIRA-interacting protein 3 n=1 Tax=Phycodurus eques TaxID=693459 RepID=UPI002ACEF089|nr:HIRA-interacting protein 3 [Phycodurus eques]